MPHPYATPPTKTSERQVGPDYVRCLEIFVTNQCNMGCTNCCVSTAQNAKEIKRLEWEDLRPAIDTFMGDEAPYKGRKTVVFAGGETFMNYPLVIQAVRYLQKFPLKPLVEVYTNGTLIKGEWVRELRYHDAKIIFSIDGGKKGNDLYRTFVAGPERSAFDEIMSRLDGLPKDGLATNTIIHPGNLDGIIEALDFFNRSGFGQIDMWIDYLHLWTPEEAARLGTFIGDFADYYVERTEKEGRIPFIVPMINHALHNGTELAAGRNWWKECFRLVLGADGNYYDCEGALLLPYERIAESNAVGAPRQDKGVDWAARQAYMDEADLYLERLGADKDWQDVCPRMYYKAMGLMGQDPKHMVENLHRVSRIFLMGLVKLASRLKGEPSFAAAYLTTKHDIPG